MTAASFQNSAPEFQRPAPVSRLGNDGNTQANNRYVLYTSLILEQTFSFRMSSQAFSIM